MEIRDQIVMQCPQCAIKHLCAALSFVADGTPLGEVSCKDILVARAYVNLEEVFIGYKSHFDFAVGLLERAEEEAMFDGDELYAQNVRVERTKLISDPDGYRNVAISLMGIAVPGSIVFAHLQEAARELPVTIAVPTEASIRSTIAEIRKEYFPSVTEERKGGEEVMACAKKKAACAACKGGKSAPAKKAACKGGKKCK